MSCQASAPAAGLKFGQMDTSRTTERIITLTALMTALTCAINMQNALDSTPRTASAPTGGVDRSVPAHKPVTCATANRAEVLQHRRPTTTTAAVVAAATLRPHAIQLMVTMWRLASALDAGLRTGRMVTLLTTARITTSPAWLTAQIHATW